MQILFLNPVDKNNIPVIGFYLLVFLAIVFLVIRLSNENYLKQLFLAVSLDENKFEAQKSGYNFSKSSFFLHVSLIILFTLGFCILTDHFFGSFNLMKNFIGVFVFYLVQTSGFVAFSSITNNAEASFVKHRLSYYEILSVLLFPFILVSLYSPINLSMMVIVVFIIVVLIAMIRSSIYLTSLISVFHIILYLCTLEIIPILFLLKFIFN